jgi:hypothetical protein
MALTRLSTILSLLLALLADAAPVHAEAASQQTTQPLVILVRDGVGTPLPGVAMAILLTGPPPAPYDSCVTDAEGECHLLIPPGAYLIQFEGGWRGQAFIPADAQNVGAMDDAGAAGGGFGIYLEPATETQVVTFVIGERGGELVPLWDMSRSPDAAPEPFAVPDSPFGNSDDALAGIDLAALTAPSEPFESTPTEAGIQVIQSAIDPGTALTPSPDQTPAYDIADDGDLPAGGMRLGLVGLAIAGSLLASAAYVFRALRSRREKQERE